MIESFHIEVATGKGTPIGNLTSQIFTNIYLNEFDRFVKHTLKVTHYLRFADDMLFLSHNKGELEALIPEIEKFLGDHLKLRLHPKKIILKPLQQGVDFLGYVTLPHHRAIRTTTKRRMLRKISKRHGAYFDGEISDDSLNQTVQSYLGMLTHADCHRLSEHIKNRFYWK